MAVIGGALLFILFLLAIVSIPFAVIEYSICVHLESIDQINVYDWSFFSNCRILTPEGFYIDVDAPGVYELIHKSPK